MSEGPGPRAERPVIGAERPGADDAAAPCPACGAALLAGEGALLRCRSCGSAVTAAPPVPAARDAGRMRPRGSRLAAPLLGLFDRQRLALLPPPPARLLDAGAGRGRFVAAARRAGYEASGLEPSERGVRAAADAYGVVLQRTGIEEARVEEQDAVTLWHVLEHLEDPGAALARIASWLRPGGTLVVGVPNVASLQARLFGERWFHLDLARHRVHFSPAGLEALLRRHGFVPVHERHVLLEHNPLGLWLSALPGAYPFRFLRGEAPFDVRLVALSIAALPLLPVAALVELAAGLARRGGTIAVVATRAR
ncbi:MAG TPA: class I SAM-dependent methyltransferase [Solirubrobacteraceae bacterium]